MADISKVNLNGTEYNLKDATARTSLADKVSKSSTSGLLKNDGTVDTTAYAKQTDLVSYLPLSGGTMTGTIITPADNTKGIIPASNNYGTIGTSSKKFNAAYITSIYYGSGATKLESKSASSGGTATSLVTTGEKYTWNNKASTSVATTSANGLMSSTDKTKLDGVATGANNYSLPLAASGTRGGIQLGYSQNNKNYPVEVSSEKAYVNVPWTDTTYESKSAVSSGTDVSLVTTGEKYNWNANIDEEDFLAQLIPNADHCTDIPSNANLNSVTYLKPGVYKCASNATAATLSNSPTTNMFMMFVLDTSGSRNKVGKESTMTYVYRQRILITYNPVSFDGNMWVSSCNSGSTAGSFSYTNWVPMLAPALSVSGSLPSKKVNGLVNLNFSGAVAGIPQYSKGIMFSNGGNDAALIAFDYQYNIMVNFRNNGTWGSTSIALPKAQFPEAVNSSGGPIAGSTKVMLRVYSGYEYILWSDLVAAVKANCSGINSKKLCKIALWTATGGASLIIEFIPDIMNDWEIIYATTQFIVAPISDSTRRKKSPYIGEDPGSKRCIWTDNMWGVSSDTNLNMTVLYYNK